MNSSNWPNSEVSLGEVWVNNDYRKYQILAYNFLEETYTINFLDDEQELAHATKKDILEGTAGIYQ